MSAVLPQPFDNHAGPDTGMETLTPRKNALGSDYVAFHTDAGTVLELARLTLEDAFRRVVLDPVRGLVILMSPSRAHETIKAWLDNLIEEIAYDRNMDSVNLHSARWRRPTDPQNTGYEADCCFYFGEKASAYIETTDQDKTTIEAYGDSHPPDLVVEVALTHVSREKQAGYRELGVPEFWQVESPRSGHLTKNLKITFLDLQADAGPRPLSESLNLPGLTPAQVCTALEPFTNKNLSNVRQRRQTIANIIQKQKTPDREPGD